MASRRSARYVDMRAPTHSTEGVAVDAKMCGINIGSRVYAAATARATLAERLGVSAACLRLRQGKRSPSPERPDGLLDELGYRVEKTRAARGAASRSVRCRKSPSVQCPAQSRECLAWGE